MENEQEKKPYAEISSGPVRAAIWKNEAKDGTRYTFSLSRTYRTDENQVRFSRSFEPEHMSSIFMAASLACMKIQTLG